MDLNKIRFNGTATTAIFNTKNTDTILEVLELKKHEQKNDCPVKKEDLFKDYPDIVTISQVMEMLHIGKTKAYKLLKTGKIWAKRDESGYYIIPKSAVKEYVLKDENQANILSANPFTSTRKSDKMLKAVVGL